jgi:hypothetical protein
VDEDTGMARELWRVSDEELVTALLTREETLRRAYSGVLDVVAEAEQRGLATSLGYKDTVALLTEATRVSRREAEARRTQAVSTQPLARFAGAAELVATGAALRRGVINGEHVREICAVFAHCPDWLPAQRRVADERTLVDAAVQASPETVRRVGRRLRAYWDQDGPKPDDDDTTRANPGREFRFRYGFDGRMRFSGEFDAETGSVLEGLLGPLAKPRATGEDGEPDRRAVLARQGDALAEIVETAARAEELSVQGGERAVLIVSVTLAELEARVASALLDVPGCDSVDQLRRLACEARVVPAVFGHDGEVLYLGRSARHASAGQRRALALRDRGCGFPGCDRKPKWCTPHHVSWWVQSGPTDLDNLVLACARHHRMLHHSEWEVRIRHGIPEFIPPPWLDPDRKPLRNTVHDPPGHSVRTAARNARHGGAVKDSGTPASSFESRTAARSCVKATSTQSPLPVPP